MRYPYSVSREGNVLSDSLFETLSLKEQLGRITFILEAVISRLSFPLMCKAVYQKKPATDFKVFIHTVKIL